MLKEPKRRHTTFVAVGSCLLTTRPEHGQQNSAEQRDETQPVSPATPFLYIDRRMTLASYLRSRIIVH
jgi:hypothetical protein